MLNLAVVIIVMVSLSLAAAAYWFFGRSADGFEVEDGPVAESEVRTKDMKDREFAEHLLRANVYTRVYEAFESATGKKPTLDEVEAIIRAYRKGEATLDGMEDYVRAHPDLDGSSGGDGDGDDEDDGKDRSGDDEREGEDRTGEDPAIGGEDRFKEGERDDKDGEDRSDNNNEEDPASGHDRFDDSEGGDTSGEGGGGGEGGGEGGDDGGGGDEDGGEGGEEEEGGAADDDILRSNVRKLLKLAGVVANKESVKRVLDRARQGLSSLTDLIAEEVQKSTK